MSSDFYQVCDKHKVIAYFGRLSGGPSVRIEEDAKLFIEDHSSMCGPVRVFFDYPGDLGDDGYQNLYDHIEAAEKEAKLAEGSICLSLYWNAVANAVWWQAEVNKDKVPDKFHFCVGYGATYAEAFKNFVDQINAVRK